MRAIGTRLKDWNVQINRGILTGFNSGFIIDGSTRARLLKVDSRSREIIKPLLEGQNIKRYRVVPEDLWLINTHNGYEGAPAVNVKDYPAIKSHLDSVEKQRASGALGEKAKKAKGLLRRDDQGRTPYNLRNCAYIPEFEKEKISWGNLSLSAQFTLVDTGVFINAPAPLITPANRYLLAVLNSKLGDYFIRSLGVIRSGGYFEYKPMFVEQLPVPIITEAGEKPFVKLVDRILAAKKTDPGADTSDLEAEIDQLVYQLYGLTPEEIAIVENSAKGRVSGSQAKNGDSEPEVEEPKKKRGRKAKEQLPASLPGWD
jgi:adenine-specific DNA-methyltransferase